MKTIGMIGGTGWISTLEYYRQLNQEVNRRLGGLEAARCILYSFNFGDIARLKKNDPEQKQIRPQILEAARRVAGAGADCLMICANTMHMFAEEIEQSVPLPLIHIAAATARGMAHHRIGKAGLLGTRPTMEMDFYKRKLAGEGIETLIPDARDREFVDTAIMTQLVRGEFRPEVRQRFIAIMEQLRGRGAQGIVLGCTEIPLLVKPDDVDIPLFDTLAIHCNAAVDFALSTP